MANPFTPTLLYPNGGESFPNGSEIVISWSMSSPVSPDDRSVQTEIYYTDNYDPLREPEWRQIAVVPGSFTTFVWKIDNFVHSGKVRLAVRSRNTRGERSSFSVSASNLSITNRKLKTPSLISPISNGRYDKYVEIAPDGTKIIGTYSQRSSYQFFYSSLSSNITKTPIAQNVPINTKSIIWNTIDLQPANDYIIYATIEDDDGNSSDILTISDVTIAHEGFFIIDTTPPVAAITINNGEEFTNTQDVSVSILSYDATTGVQSMELIEGTNVALPEPIASVRPLTLSEPDGTKVVELLLQDFGANRNNDSVKHLFETVLNQNGLTIVDSAFDSASTAWVVTSGLTNSLYSIPVYPEIVFTFYDVPTSVAVYESLVYVGTKSSSNRGTLYRYTGSFSVTSINTFTEADSVINCMATFGNLLYLGFENGNVYSYDSGVLVKVAQMQNPISSIISDGNSLYLALQNDDNIYIYNNNNFVKTGE